MKQNVIDAHIQFDMYTELEQSRILQNLDEQQVTALISVSNHLQSAQRNLALSINDIRIKPAFGFHPEQSLLSDDSLDKLIRFIHKHKEKMIAIGEVGLPYYLRKSRKTIPLKGYIEVLEQFIQLAAKINKPIVLHAVYEDAPIVIDLLEKYSFSKAHFHWFKGDRKTMEHMQENGYFISVTPDILYEKEIQQLVDSYAITHMMAETDGPWSFNGPYKGKQTNPNMLHSSLAKIAEIKRMDPATVYQKIYENTIRFYRI